MGKAERGIVSKGAGGESGSLVIIRHNIVT